MVSQGIIDIILIHRFSIRKKNRYVKNYIFHCKAYKSKNHNNKIEQ